MHFSCQTPFDQLLVATDVRVKICLYVYAFVNKLYIIFICFANKPLHGLITDRSR